MSDPITRLLKASRIIRSKQTCWCGFKIRGENHEEGEHHRQGMNRKGHAHIGPTRRSGKGK